jgi:hypothetical protein
MSPDGEPDRERNPVDVNCGANRHTADQDMTDCGERRSFRGLALTSLKGFRFRVEAVSLRNLERLLDLEISLETGLGGLNHLDTGTAH